MLPLQQTIQFSNYSILYDLIIPRNNLLRQINDLIDFSFIKKELVDKYCQDNGRSSRMSHPDVQISSVENNL